MRLAILPFLLLPGLFAQHKVNLRNTYQRLLCVVPIVGAGTPADPRRPEFAPANPHAAAASRSGILAYTWQPTDDGKSAIVEFVAQDRSAFQGILAAKRPDVKVFEKSKTKKADLAGEFKKVKKDFDPDTFWVNVP